MSLTLHTHPQQINLSGNPVKIVVSSDIIADNHYAHAVIKVPVTSGNITSYKEIGHEKIPVISGFAEFDVSDYFKTTQKLDITIFNFFKQTIQDADFLISDYRIDIFETYNENDYGNVYFQLLTKSIQGGFSSILLKNYENSNKNFYDNFLVEEKKFLTWSENKKLTWNQHDLLFFTQTTATQILSCRAHFTLYFSDNSTENIFSEYSDIEKNKFYFIVTSILGQNFLSLETTNKQLVKYDVFIEDVNSNIVTETKTYYIDRTYYNQQKQIIFRNSLGAYDIISLKGVNESTNEIQRTIGNFIAKSHVTFSEYNEVLKGNSGFISTQFKDARNAKKYIIDLINSKEIYEIVGKEIIPVIPTTKKVNIIKSNEYIYSFNFDYRYAYSDEYFSPYDDSQYFNPILLYRNGTITNAEQGATATLTFEALINADASIRFVANWGNDVGITEITEAMQKNIWKTITMQILIPENSYPVQKLEITDDIGGRYILNYNINIFAENMSSFKLYAYQNCKLVPYNINIDIDPATLTNEGDAQLSATAKEITVTATGTISNLYFKDTAGNEYLFPFTEGASGDEKLWTVHDVLQGERMFLDGSQGTWLWIQQIDFLNFYNLKHGVSELKELTPAGTYQRIGFVPYDENNKKIYNP